MLKALKRIIVDLTQENITTGVAKSINAMSYCIETESYYTPKQREFARKVWEKSGRAYKGFIPTMKQLIEEYKDDLK